MHIYRAIFRQILRKNRGVPYLAAAWVLGATTVTARLWPECTYPFESMAGMGWRSLGGLSYTLGTIVWAALLQALDAQLSPAAVQLVPGLRRGAIIVALASWFIMAALLALQTCVYGAPFPLLFGVLLVALAIMVSRTPSTRKYPLILLFLLWAPIYGYHVPLPDNANTASWLTWMAALSAMALGATFVVTQLGKHAEVHAQRHDLARPGPNNPREGRAQSAWDAILRRPKPFQWVFDRVLRTRSAEARMLHGLGTLFHWSHAVFGVAFQAVPVGLLMYALLRLLAMGEMSEEGLLDSVMNMASLNAFFFAVMLADFRVRELHARRKEQALLLLLPGAPTGGAVNRWLMQTQVLHHLIAIVFGLWLVLGVAFVLHRPLESTLRMTAPPLVASLLMTPVLVRDYARMRQPRPLQYLLLALVALAPLYWTVGVRHSIDPMIAILVALPLSGMIAAWRYARLADAPPAFPVGRLAPR